MTMTSCVRLFLGAAIVCLSAQGVGAHEVNARAKQCPNNANIRGYTSIAELNQDQFDEAMKIGDGTSKSSPPYSFVLCPNTQFDMSKAPLRVLLNGAVFSCGSELEPSSSNGCFFNGGMSQVTVADSTISNYELVSATMVGITFEQFNGTAIDVTATESFTLTLMDVVWKNFFSDFIIRQQRKFEGAYSARVEVIDGVIINGIGGSLFSNDGGVLILERLVASKVTAPGLVSTSNGGVSMIFSSMISDSTIDTIASATVGSSVSVTDTEVSRMVFTKSIFHAENAGSRLFLNQTVVRGIDHNMHWHGVLVNDYAKAFLYETAFDNNKNFVNLVEARASSSIEISNSLFEDNVGRNPTIVSNAIHASEGSSIILRRTKFIDNTNQTALVFAATGSSVEMERSCIMGGNTDEVVFVSSDSDFVHLENNVAADVVSNSCPFGGGRLSKEEVGTQCHREEDSFCEKRCDILGDHVACMADENMFTARQVVNGTDTNTTSPSNVTLPPTNITTPPVPEVNSTVPPTDNTTNAPGGTAPPRTTAPTRDDEISVVVAFGVRNDMRIANGDEILASGLGEAFPIFAEEVVSNLTINASQELIAGSAEVYEIVRTSCEFVNMDTNMTSNFTTCHQALGRYNLTLADGDDPSAVLAAFTQETRNKIDDGTLQGTLLRVEPTSPLLAGPSLDLIVTVAPTSPGATIPPTSISPTITISPISPVTPTCAPVPYTSRSKGSKGNKGSKGKGFSASKSRKTMRMHRQGGSGAKDSESQHIPAEGHNFVNEVKDHDDGKYYSPNEHEEEAEMYQEEHDDEMTPGECVDPEEVGSAGKKAKSKGSKSKKSSLRRLRDHVSPQRSRVHGGFAAQSINDLHKKLEAELKADKSQSYTA